MKSLWCRRYVHLLLAVLAVLWGIQVTHGQTAGTITGAVTDSSGAAVPKATVTITNTLTGAARTLETNTAGVYTAEALPVGTYQVAVEAAGFERSVHSGITLNVTDRLAIDFVLQIGAVTQTVEVRAEAAMVQTQTGDQSTLVTTRQISEIPMLGRNFMQLQQMVSGASKTGADEIGKGFYGERGYAINGFSERYVGYQLDGVQNTDMGNQGSTLTNPAPDTLAELKVLTSNYSAKYGTEASSNILAVTKSGTRDFHGTAYEYLRNDKLDAADFFLNRANGKKVPLRYNNFGYNLGGPFYIPGHYNTSRTKTFFFWSEEWIKQRTASPVNSATPTQAMRNGDFTGYGPLTNPINQATGNPMTDSNDVPCVGGTGMTQINPKCLNNNVELLLKQNFPLPTLSSGFLNYVVGATSGQDWREELIRVDQNVTDKMRVFVRYIQDSWIENDPLVAWTGDAFPTLHSQFNIPSRNLIVKMTTVASPTLLNEISYNYASNYPASSTPGMQILGQTQRPAGYNAQLVFNENIHNMVPDMNFSGGWGGINGLWGPWWAHHNVSMASDDLTKQISTHSLQAGAVGMFSITPVESQTVPSRQGSYSFDGHFTGNPVADALLGLPNTYGELHGYRMPYYNYHQAEIYFQDDWKATKRLTLNLGLRWFYIPHVYSDQITMFMVSHYNPGKAPTVTPGGIIVAGSGDTMNGIVYPGQNGIPRGLTENHWNTFAPRIGFAWDLFGDGKTAIRGGYGMGYHRIEGNDEYSMVMNPPYSRVANFFSPPFDNPAAGAAAPLTPPSLGGVDPVYKVPMAQNWSLGVQRELTPNLMLSVAYVGSRGSHINYTTNINQPLPAMGYDFDPRIACTATTPYPCTGRVSTDYVRPYQGWSSISNWVTDGYSIYHSLQVNLQKKLSHGLTLGTAYTWSKGVGLFETTPQNYYNRRADRGEVSFDRTHVLVVNYVYELPFARSLTGLAGGVAKGWEASGIVTFESGFPLTPGFSSATAGLASRPDLVSGASIAGPKSVAQWFNTSAFAAPPFGHFGNAGLGLIRGPGMNQWDLGFFKNFNIKDRGNVQFRAEMLNAWNHANFNGVDTTYGDGAFGQITSAHLARVIQLALRLSF